MPLVSNSKFVASIAEIETLVSPGPLDICKTPAPPAPAPVPIPYPNIATTATPGPGYSTKTLVMGTPAFTRKSKIGVSNGDQPGVAMGLISNRIMGMAKATMASTDVFIEGGAVVRTFDLGGSNMGSPFNTPGTFQGGVMTLPILQFDSADFPNKVVVMKQGMGNTKSKQLTRQTGRSKIRRNRRAALKGKVKAGPGMSLDEFPFASTKQGGKGAAVAAIPTSEQNAQGGKLSSFYQKNNIKDGDSFIVEVV